MIFYGTQSCYNAKRNHTLLLAVHVLGMNNPGRFFECQQIIREVQPGAKYKCKYNITSSLAPVMPSYWFSNITGDTQSLQYHAEWLRKSTPSYLQGMPVCKITVLNRI
jgi:hypothetical protein